MNTMSIVAPPIKRVEKLVKPYTNHTDSNHTEKYGLSVPINQGYLFHHRDEAGFALNSGEVPPATSRQKPSVLLLTVGPLAAAIAEAVAIIQTRWLPDAEPLQQIQLAEDQLSEANLHEISCQLQTLCSFAAQEEHPSELAQDRNAGRQASCTAIKVWLLLDLLHDGAVDHSPHLNSEVITTRIRLAQQLLERLMVAACRTLPATVTPQILLLLNPSDRALADRCWRLVNPMVAEPLYLIGAKPQTMIRQDWQQRAATAVAAQLWANDGTDTAISTEETIEGTTDPRYSTIGASCRPLPTAEVIRTMALLTVQETIQQIIAKQRKSNGGAASDQHDSISRPQRSAAELAEAKDRCGLLRIDQRADQQLLALITDLLAVNEQAIPQPKPILLHRTKPRSWRDTARPLQTLLTHTRWQQRSRQTAIRSARHDWLAAQLAQWSAAWQHFCGHAAYESGMAGDPIESTLDMPSKVRVAWLKAESMTLAKQIDDALAKLAATSQQYETELQQAGHALERFSNDLPTLSLDGLLRVMRQPSAWPRWFWQRTFILPQRLRHFGRLITKQEATLHKEANLHLRRQLALAMLQDFQQQIAWYQEIDGNLDALATYLDRALADAFAQLPAPWDRAHLGQLRQDLLRGTDHAQQDGQRILTALLRPTAAEEWIDSSVETIAETLVDTYASLFDDLHSWSYARWLTVIVPQQTSVNSSSQNGVQSSAQSALFQWFDEMIAEAAVLWPTAEMPADSPIIRAIAIPTTASKPAAITARQVQELPPEIQAWLNCHPNIASNRSPAAELIALQQMALA